MKIGIFYDSVEDFHEGKPSKIGTINGRGEWVSEVPSKVAAKIKGSGFIWNDIPGHDDDKHIKDLIPNHALETADICETCGETLPCNCVETDFKTIAIDSDDLKRTKQVIGNEKPGNGRTLI